MTRKILNKNQIKKIYSQTEQKLARNVDEYLDRLSKDLNWTIKAIRVLGGVGGVNLLITLHDKEFVLKMPAYPWIIQSSLYFFERVKDFIPVPKIFYFDISKKVIPYEFMTMEYIEGLEYYDLKKQERYEAGLDYAKLLKRIHKITVSDFQNITSFKTWTLEAWQKRLRYYSQVTEEKHPFEKEEVQFVQSLTKDTTLFSKKAHLLHGDAKGENAIYYKDKNSLKIKSIIDPNSFVGDPLMDVAISLSHHIEDSFSEGYSLSYEIQALSDNEEKKLHKYMLFYLFWLIQNKISKEVEYEKELKFFKEIIQLLK